MSRTKLAKAKAALISASLLCLIQPTFTPVAYAAAREVTITLNADDNISGVAMMQIAADKNNPPAAITFSRTTVVSTEASILWVRVQDRALNWSAWVEVQVGGAPVIRDPLAKTVYVPVPLVAYVPPPPTTPTPSTPAVPQSPSSGASFGGGGGGVSVAVVEKIAETATTLLAPVSETLTSISPLPIIETSVVTAPVVVKPTLTPKVSLAPAGVKPVPATSKPAVSMTLSLSANNKVSLKMNKSIEVKLAPMLGTGSINVSIIDSSGKKMKLDATWDKKTGKITIPKLAFSKIGSYTLTATVGKKTSKLSIAVSK